MLSVISIQNKKSSQLRINNIQFQYTYDILNTTSILQQVNTR